MLKIIALRIALLTTMWAVPLVAQSETPIIRTVTGCHFEVPAGWEWIEFDGFNLTIQHLETKSGEKGKESSPNRLSIGCPNSPDDAFDKGWGELDRGAQLDRSGQRTLPNGATARWKAGKRWGHMNLFMGEATIGSRVMSVVLYVRPLDWGIVEAAFLRVAETLREVPKSAVIYHPSLRIAVDQLTSKAWYARIFDGHNIAFTHYANGIISSKNAHIYAFPASKVFPDTGKALAHMTDYFEKNSSIKVGEVRRGDVPGGEVLWTEQLGTSTPFLAAVRRDGHYFFLQMNGGESVTSAKDADAVREDFLAVAKSVRAWDGN